MFFNVFSNRNSAKISQSRDSKSIWKLSNIYKFRAVKHGNPGFMLVMENHGHSFVDDFLLPCWGTRGYTIIPMVVGFIYSLNHRCCCFNPDANPLQYPILSISYIPHGILVALRYIPFKTMTINYMISIILLAYIPLKSSQIQ